MRGRLYTTLVAAKLTLNDGEIPSHTPVPDGWAQQIVDPETVPGLGALQEDPTLGLKCPVQGCGEWRHNLGIHIARAHRDIGGCSAVRLALEIPKNVGLVSGAERERLSIRSLRYAESSAARIMQVRPWEKRRGTRKIAVPMASTHARNFRSSCEAQVGHRMWDLRNRLGRSPSYEEAKLAGESQLISACIALYGSWNNAKIQIGIDYQPHRRSQWNRERVLSAFAEYHRIHGAWPLRHADAVAPLLPSREVIKKALGVSKWSEALNLIWDTLGFHNERGTRPTRRRARAAA